MRRSTDGSDSSDEDSAYEQVTHSARSVRHASSSSTLPSQDLNVHYNKRMQHPHHNYSHHPHPHTQHHLTVNAMPRGHHPQAVYLSPNPSSNGAQGPPIYYPAPTGNGYPHTPNSMVHREIDEDYDGNSAADGLGAEPNAYHRLQMQQPKYQTYHPGMHGTAGPYGQPGEHLGGYYSQNLPTPAVSPASSCSGPNNLPPPSQYTTGGANTTSAVHHSPPTNQTATGANQHQPTPYQPGHPSASAAHPQPMHYAAAYSGHGRLYGEVQDSSMPRVHSYSTGQNGHGMPTEPGTHGLGISMNGGQSMKVEVATPVAATAW